MKLHGFGVGLRQGEASTCPTRWTDGPEQIGIGVSLVGRLSWPCAASCPLPHDAVLLTKSGFILEPDFNRRVGRQMVKMGLQGVREVFLNAAIVSASWPGLRGRALTWLKPSCFRSFPVDLH
jgi:hypothetical protein